MKKLILWSLLAAWFAVASVACGATATNPSPANFATADTHTTTMKDFLARKSKASTTYASGGMFFAYASTGTSSKPPADYRAAFGEDYKVNGIVKLSWKGTSGTSTVKITRLSDGDVRTFTTSGTSVDFLAPEIGRNYKWTVRNGGTESGPWYFFTDGEAPRIIPQELSVVGNCRDMGGWVTEDGKYRVRQGLGYRNDHNADFAQYAQLKPFWTDIAGIRTDMDLRDTLGSSNWYCNYELDSNANHPGRSPYGQHWWDVLYWNVLREGDYGAVMNAYAALVEKIGASPASADSKKASANTWKCLADAQYLPVVVHCSQGRDRTGTVAFVLLGALGVGLNDLYADWALTDYAAPSDFPKATSNEGGSTIVALYNAIRTAYPDSTYPTLQSKCEKLLTDLGMTDNEIKNLKSYWLEPVEAKLTAVPGGASVAVPTLSATRVRKENAKKPTVTVNTSNATVDYGGGTPYSGDYDNYGKFLVTVTLKDPTTTHWADGTIGPKVLPFIIEHEGNVVQANVLSFIKGDTSPHIRIGRPRYLGEVSCSYTEEQLNNLPPGDYEATFTAKTCEMASKVNTTTNKFKVYPATEKATYAYEYADLKSAFFKTDYAPAIRTDKVEVRMMDQTDGEGYAPFACGPYPASLTIMKMSGGFLRYHHGGQRVDNDPGTWTVNKIYKLTANGKSITHYDESTAKTVTKSFSAFDGVNPTPGTAYIGCAVEKTANMGAEGTPGDHQPHRIYHVKAWANGSSLIHEFVPCKTTSGYAMLYDKVTKKIYPFSHTCDKTGTVTLGGTATEVDGGDDPEPEPTPTSAFDAAHTIVCYGDSLTWGTAAGKITMDDRPNYHDGRLAGVSGVPESYTYWLSGMISDYNVINQSREGSPASHMTAWSGESEVVVDRSFTLPATGSVSIPTNLVFTSDCPWGKWGRWAAYPSKWDDPVETFEHWAGFVTPIFPLYERYDGEKTRFSVTGTLCGRHVRVQGIYPNVTTVTVFGTGTAQTVAVGAKFVPDNATLPLYTQGIRILCGSGNDGYYGYHGGDFDDGFAKYAKPYFDAFAAKGGKFLIVSQCCQTEDSKLGEEQYQSSPTDMETKMAAAYGAHYLNLRMAFMTNGVETAKALGVWPEGSTKPWYDPSTLFADGTHFTSAGYKVMAEFIRRKLVEIGYVEGDRPTPVSYRTWNETTRQMEDCACADCTFVTAGTATFADGKWYAVTGTVERGSIAVNGTAHLILCDGAKLTATAVTNEAGIAVAAGNSLTIYGQQHGTGELVAKNTWMPGGGGYAGACIGGVLYDGCGAVTINGGVITALSNAFGAGIGGAWGGSCGNITINGGKVTARGMYGAGIGDGGYGTGGMVTINGGTVDASHSYTAADIGVGWHGSGTTVSINGGNVKAATIENAPTNSANAAVWCVTVECGVQSAECGVEIEGLDGYGTNDIYPIDDRVYLWLPNGNYRFTVGGIDYFAKVKDADTTAIRSILITPGTPLAPFETAEEATNAMAAAVITPSDDVAAALGSDAAIATYRDMFGFDVVPTSDGKWAVEALLLPEPWTNVVLSAQAATLQVPVADIASLELGVPTNVTVKGCGVPGFYYSFYSGSTVTNLTALADEGGRNVLCSPSKDVKFSGVAKPSDAAGFFSVGVMLVPGVGPSDERPAAETPAQMFFKLRLR